MNKGLNMLQDEKQAFELMKECAEKYPHFTVIVKNYPHVFTLSQPYIPEYKFEFNLKNRNINIRNLKGFGCTMHLFFSDEYVPEVTSTYGSKVFVFYKDKLNEVMITFFRDLEEDDED